MFEFANARGHALVAPAGVAAQFAITLRGDAGVRVVCEFLELNGLSAVVGASYGSKQALNAAVETAVVAQAKVQRAALAEDMAPQQITVHEDVRSKG